jgi:2-C-methyl-D-erythritol 4-phosphate cytidylyltransferase
MCSEYDVVIPAAGQGKRMQAGKNKQFILLRDIPVIVHTLKVFQRDEKCKSITLVVNENEIDEFEHLIHSYSLRKVSELVIGGCERQHSVFNGVKVIRNSELILVHDGARPFISIPFIHTLVQEASKEGVAVLAVPVKDTIKKVVNHEVAETIDRSLLWAVQTPQAFSPKVLLDVHERAEHDGFIGTDDASLAEHYGYKVAVVEGDYQNIKLTTRDDLLYAEAILAKQGGN